MTRLTDARAALESLRDVLDRASMPISLDQLERALARMAQLEKVAELARDAVEQELGTDASGPLWDLSQALAELDNHPETKE